MAIKAKKKVQRGLGKGIDALMGGAEAVVKDAIAMQGGVPSEINISNIVIGKSQPRKVFDEDSIKELSSSIKSKGILQPLLIRPLKNDKYEVVAGERRYRAAKIAGLKKIPVAIKEMSDIEAHEIALIENIQREDLNAMEESMGYKKMIEEFDYTQEKLSKVLGKSRSHIANTLRLLTLPKEIQKMVNKNEITAGHARSLIGIENAEKLAKDIVDNKLTVRDIEKISKKNKPSHKNNKDKEITDIEDSISSVLNEKVNISKTKNGGNIKISFSNEDSLKMIVNKLKS